MGKRCRESDSDGATAAMAESNTVFVDTSLDTHLAMLVSDSDTVSDFKKKIVLEHMQCFPAVGEIKIHSLKVKRRSNFYYLPDILLVWSAFRGLKGNWFLSVDASTTLGLQVNQKFCEPGTSDCVKVKDADDCRDFSSDVKRTEILPMAVPNDAHERNDVSGMTASVKFDKSLERATDFHRDTHTEEDCVETEVCAKKKRKMRHTEDVCHNPFSRDSCTLLLASSDAKHDQSDVEVAAENSNLDLDRRKQKRATLEGIIPENLVAGKHPTENLGVTSNAVPDHSATSINATDVKKDVNSNGNKRKKEKASKMAANGKTHADQTGMGESTKLCAETHKSEQKEGEKDSSLNHDHDASTPSNRKSLDNTAPDLAQKESFLSHEVDAAVVGEPEISSGGKKKRKKNNKNKNKNKNKIEGGEKAIGTTLENIGIEQTINGISGTSGLIGSSINHVPEASDEEERTSHRRGQGKQMKLLYSSRKDGGEKVKGADGNGADFVVSTLTSQILEDVASAEKVFEKRAHISLGNGHEDLPPVEKDQIVRFNLVEKNGETTEQKDKKAKKKRERVQLGESDVKMKDAEDGRGLSSDLNSIESLQMAMLNDAHENNQVSSDKKNEQLNAEGMAENTIFDSGRRKGNTELEGVMPENILASKLECKPVQAVPTESWGISSNEVPDHSTRLMDGNGAVEDVNSNRSKRKKKKLHIMVAEIQDKTHVEQTGKGENAKPDTEIHKPEEKEEEKNLSLEHDHEVIVLSNENSSYTAAPNPAQKGSIDAHAVVEPDISGGTKKKKKKRMANSAGTNLEVLGIEKPINGISHSDLICTSADHIPEASAKEESASQYKGQNDANEKVMVADGRGADFVIASSENMEKKTQNSTGNAREDFTPIEKDQLARFSQVDKNCETKESKGKKTKKKRKKAQHTASDVPDILPVEVQKAGVEKEDGHVASSSALTSKSEEKAEEMNGTAASTGDFARASENEGKQDKDSGNLEKRATKSNSRKSAKQAKENGLPPTSISIELETERMASENLEIEHQSRVRKTGGSRQGDFTDNSNQDEVVPNSSRTSQRVSGMEVKDYAPSEMQQSKTLQKPDEIPAASPFPKEKNVFLNKSSLEKSGLFPESQGNESGHTSGNATKKMVARTPPRKKSLLTKPGAIFQDNSGESSGDENGNVFSESSTHRTSYGSALSSDSDSGESDLSQDSTRKGSNDPKDQSTGGRNATTLDLSDSKEVTLDMILKSSNRFKNAKLQASQNELDDSEFVPDSQPVKFDHESQLV